MQVLVLGAGQLARMTCLAAEPLNIKIMAYDVGQGQVQHPITRQALGITYEQALTQVDVVTAEFEHIPADVLKLACESGKLKPGAVAIQTGGDRRIEKALLDKVGVASSKHQVVSNQTEFRQAITQLGLPLVFKTAKDGYDGKGQWRLKDPADADQIWQEMEQVLEQDELQGIVAEQFISFDREVSVIGARNAAGEIQVYSLTENHHEAGVLSVSTALGESSPLQKQAEKMFTAIAEGLDYIGILAVELFQEGDTLLVNEIAPRVHNSGHWTQQGAYTCQFENHIRAVCGLPLGSTELVHPTLMVNILGEDNLSEQIFAIPGCAMHWYDKEKREGRKMGHINLSANTPTELAARLSELAPLLPAQTQAGIQVSLDSLNTYTQAAWECED